jgi:PH (Pleckstrin Homology) domain-containing protein
MAESRIQPKVYRPLGARMVSGVSAAVIVSVMVFLWLMLPARVQAEFGWFQRGTLIMFFVAVLVLLYGVFRTRADVSEPGLSVTNGFRHYEFAWAEIVAISLGQHRPWALIDLADGSTRSVMALQASDGPRATAGAREIAALIDGSSTPGADR